MSDSSGRLQALADAGVSIWLDDLSRERIETGNLADLVKNSSVVGVTTNPSIFAAALANGERYDEQLRSVSGRSKEEGDGGDEVGAAIFALTTEDVRNACDVLEPIFSETPQDGRVSIEVSPRLAHETQATIDEAQKLWDTVGRSNALIKIPATKAGLPAITEVIGRGISVNVTLIFSTERYREVMDAYLAGLEQAAAAGVDLSKIQSVASFFVSRVDTEIDKRLDAIGGDDATQLKGKAAVANAWIAYGAFEEVFAGERWEALAAQGAHAQRPLWASTGVKNPNYSDTLYVSELVVDGCVNTMPEKTLQAFADHGEVEGDTVTGRAGQGQQIFDRLAELGIDFDDVFAVLEDEGVSKFVDSWGELEETVKGQLAQVSE